MCHWALLYSHLHIIKGCKQPIKINQRRVVLGKFLMQSFSHPRILPPLVLKVEQEKLISTSFNKAFFWYVCSAFFCCCCYIMID